MDMYLIGTALLLIGAFAALTGSEGFKMKVCALFAGISSILTLIASLKVLLTGQSEGMSVYFSSLFGKVDFIIDPLSAFFLLVISVMCFIGTIYGAGYMKPYIGKEMPIASHGFFLMLLIASMELVVTVHNALFFLVVWEIMSLSSFFLVIFEGNKKDVLSAGIKYMIYMHISVIFIIAAFALLSIKAGSFDFYDFASVMQKNSHLAQIAFLLAFIGFGTKAGFVPFHNWLPSAHPAAPTHVSGIMSGVMIKTGIYGILRILFLCSFVSKPVAYGVLIISVISALWGLLYAITRHDIKELLAYSSIENIGITGIGIGIGLIGVAHQNPVVAVLGFSGGFLHILNHSIFKELLFFAAGNIYTKTHTRDIEKLGGLIKKMPFTAALFIVGSVAICALPPFNGFIGEFFIYAAMIAGLPVPSVHAFILIVVSLAALAFIGTMAILCFTKETGVMFLGTARSDEAQNVNEDVSPVMLAPMIVLAVASLFIGLFPQVAITLILSPVSMFIHTQILPQIFMSLAGMCSTLSFLFFIFIAIIIFTTLFRFALTRKSSTHTTWGCGYDKPTSRMQYSASSYADLFVSTMKPLFKRITHMKKPKGLFPDEAYREVETKDIEEAYIIKPILKSEEKLLTFFERIQDGNLQHYILAGLVFLIIAATGLIYFG